MSRLVVKNLPKSITQDYLQKHFSSKGEITDIQLKFTPDGKFRQFAFIGYKSEEEAAAAKEFFHGTHIKTNKINVEVCVALGDTTKPKAWSKYAADSTAYEKLHPKEKENDTKKKKEKEIIKANETENLLEKYSEDPQFQEFLEVQNKKNVLLNTKKTTVDISENDIEEEHDSGKETGEDVEDKECSDSDDDEEEEEKAANKSISDLEYLQQLKNKTTETKRKKQEKVPKQKIELFTVKLKGLPYTCKKKDIKQFLKPVNPYTIRLPRNAKGFAYAGFKTEKQKRQALEKDKSFIGGKQITVLPYDQKDSVQSDDKSQRSNKWISQEEALKNEEDIAESGRIFLRNLSYTITEEDIEKMFSSFGPLTEVDLPIDSTSRKLKGFATVTFLMPEHAVQAYSKLDGTVLHGRMLHLLPAKTKISSEASIDDNEITNYKLKKQKQIKGQINSTHNWNTLFMGHNEVAEVVAKDFGLSKGEVLEGDNVAVRLALGETELVTKAKAWLEQEGVCIDVFNEIPKKRSKTVILVKNLPAMTEANEIKQLFTPFGVLGRVLLPPSGVTAIVEFCETSEARKAFMKLAYSKFKNRPLYLEWAPEGSLKEKENLIKENKLKEQETLKNEDKQTEIEEVSEEIPEEDTTIFVRNLNFSTTDRVLEKHFEKCGKIHYARVATKKDPRNPKSILSMGYGFVQFMHKSGSDKALKTLQNSVLEDKTLELKRSQRTLEGTKQTARKTSKPQLKKQNGTKIMVKNVPFQANKKEIMELFQAFGEIKALRLPKKMSASASDNHRGFAFVDYFTNSDAKKAFEALSQSTHLYGRRLVLEWASVDDEEIEQLRKRTAEHFQPEDQKEKRKKKSVLNLESGKFCKRFE